MNTYTPLLKNSFYGECDASFPRPITPRVTTTWQQICCGTDDMILRDTCETDTFTTVMLFKY